MIPWTWSGSAAGYSRGRDESCWGLIVNTRRGHSEGGGGRECLPICLCWVASLPRVVEPYTSIDRRYIYLLSLVYCIIRIYPRCDPAS